MKVFGFISPESTMNVRMTDRSACSSVTKYCRRFSMQHLDLTEIRARTSWGMGERAVMIVKKKKTNNKLVSF
jgi:hypothetical protein